MSEKADKKNLQYYLNLNYPITIDTDEDNGRKIYIAEIPDLPGCSAYAESTDKALTELQDAKKAWIEASLKRNLSIPEPVQEDLYSGKFLLRIPTRLHMNLAKEAEKNNLSLNQHVRQLLEQKDAAQAMINKINEFHEKIRKDIKALRNDFQGQNVFSAKLANKGIVTTSVVTKVSDTNFKEKKSYYTKAPKSLKDKEHADAA